MGPATHRPAVLEKCSCMRWRCLRKLVASWSGWRGRRCCRMATWCRPRRRRRTVRPVELSIAALTSAAERAQLAAIVRVSKTADTADPDDISESPIPHNDEAYAVYRWHAEHKPQAHRKPSPERRTNTADNNRIRASAERDRGRARQRCPRAGKPTSWLAFSTSSSSRPTPKWRIVGCGPLTTYLCG